MSTHTDTDPQSQSFNSQTVNNDMQEGDTLYFQSRYFEAHEFYVSFLKQITESQENNLSDLAPLYHKLGLSALKIGSFSDSISYLTQGLEIIESREEDSLLEKARILSVIGESLFEEARYLAAEEEYKQALEILKEKYGDEQKELAIIYNGLAHIRAKQEKMTEGLDYLEMAEKICLQQNVEKDIVLANIYFRYSYIYWIQQKTEKANEYIQKALKMRQQIYGESHVEIAQCYIILGRITQQKEQYSEALEYYNQGQNMLIHLLGDDHLELAKCYFGMFCVYYSLEDYEASSFYYERVMVIKEKFLHQNHLNLALTYAHFGYMFDKQGKPDDAEYLYNKALKIFEERGEPVSIVELCLENLTIIYKERNLYSQARRMLKRKLTIQLKNLNKDDVRVADSYGELASLYFRDAKTEKALRNAISSIKINNSQKQRRFSQDLSNFYVEYFLFEKYSDINSQESLLKKIIPLAIQCFGRNPESLSLMYLKEIQQKKCLTDTNLNFNV